MSIDYNKARRLLARRDPVLRDLMRRHGACGLAAAQHEDPFRALVHAIIAQQLSTKAAATIERRVHALIAERASHGQAPSGFLLTPGVVAVVTDPQLRGAGMSFQKIRYLRDLCARVEDGSLDLGSFHEMPDEAVITALTEVKGIGRWTAEMFLMFRLHRPDVLPVGDLGIVKAVQRAYGLRKVPTADRLRRLGEPWRPYRSVACWYLWASLDNAPLSE